MTSTLRILLGIIAALAGVIAGVIGNTLSINIVYLFNKKGRKPASRSFAVWFTFFTTTIISVVFGSVAAFAPSPVSATPTSEVSFTPEIIQPARLEFDVDTLTVYDQQDDILWTKRLEGRIIKAEIEDLDGDQIKDVVVGVAQNDQLIKLRQDDTGKVINFDQEGNVQWEVNFNDLPTYAINAGGKTGIVVINNFLIADMMGDSKKEIAVVVHDLLYYSSKLTLLSFDGKIGGEYWHPGFIYEVKTIRDSDKDRTLIVTRAVNNDLAVTYNANPSTLFTLDPSNIRGQAPPYIYFQVEKGTQLWYGLISKPADIIDIQTREMSDGPDLVVAKLNTGYYIYINAVTGEVVNILADNTGQQQSLPEYTLFDE